MKKKRFVPMTLENVGSEGRLITDKTLLKLMGVALGSFVISIIVCQKILVFLPSKINLIIGIIIFLLVFQHLARKFALMEGLLKNMYYNLKKNEKVNVGKFSDIYDVLPGGICLHENGQISCFIEIVRGTTLGESEWEIDNYVTAIKNFEDAILQEKLSFKNYNIEVIENDYSLFRVQKIKTARNGLTKLSKNLEIKNTYLKTFMDYCVRDERDIYVVISKYAEIEMFRIKMEQIVNATSAKLIKDIHILKDKEEVRDFGIKYFDVDLFELENVEDEELNKIIKFKE